MFQWFGLARLGIYSDYNIWEFPKIRGTLFWGPYNKDLTS